MLREKKVLGLTFTTVTAIMTADKENMIAGSSMTTAAPTLVPKNPMAASQPLQRERGTQECKGSAH